jgi:predicted Zn-dependent peptidase
MIRPLACSLLVVAASCGPAKTNTQPAPFPTTTGDIAPVGPAPTTPTEPSPPMTQTAQPQDLAFPDEAFRAEQPKPGPARPFNLPKMQPFTLKNGIKVYLVEQHTLPIVSAELNFDGGSIVDPEGKDGLSSVCMAMLTEGTQRLDKIAYSEALADIASSIGASASDDSQSVSMGSLSKHFETTFALFVETLWTPGFRAEDLDRMIKRRIEAVRQAKAAPASVAGRVAGAVLYGAKHPLGAVTTEASLAAITIDDCKAHHAKWLKPGRARLFVVGDLTEAQVRQYFDGDQLAGWTGKAPAMPTLPAPKTMAGKIFLVDIPGAAQSQISMMHFGPKRTAPDYFQTMVMTSVLGGGFASRVNMNLREDKGYSYGARGGFSYTKQYGWFTGAASVRTDATYQSLLELTREVTDLKSGKIKATADEIDREKTGAILGLPGRFQTGSASLGQFRGLVYFGLPLDYYDSYVAKVGKVGAAQVTAAATKYLQPYQAVYLVVGDANAKMIRHEPAVLVPWKDGDPVDTKVVKKENGKDVAYRRVSEKRDVPLQKDGKDVTLKEALTDLLATGEISHRGRKGQLVVLDADGVPVQPAK